MALDVRRKKKEERKIASERINILFSLAEKYASQGNLRRATRYAQLAWRIGMRYNVHLPSYLKKKYCRGCHVFLMPGVNCSVRLTGNRITMKCGNCGRYYRHPFLKEKRSSRK